MEDAFKWIASAVLAVVTAVSGWLVKTVLGNREDNIRQTEKIRELEGKVSAVITKEDIREIIAQALDQRDAFNAVRRREWDAPLELRLKQAVMESSQKSQKFSRTELEEILRKVLDQREQG